MLVQWSCVKESKPTSSIILRVFTTRYVVYCMKMVEMVLENGIIPILVFDGSDVPIKDKENGRREEFVSCRRDKK